MSDWLLMANVFSEHICRAQYQLVKAMMADSVAGLSG